MHAKSFGRPLELLEELEEAVATYTARIAEKLRKQGSVASCINVFLHTNQFQPEQPQYANDATRVIHFPTAFTPDLIGHAIALLRCMYREGYKYKKAGVFLTRITPQAHLQCDLFGDVTLEQQQKKVRLMQAVDAINHLWGQDTIFFGAQVRTRTWQMRQERRSPRYTTRWQELLEVSV